MPEIIVLLLKLVMKVATMESAAVKKCHFNSLVLAAVYTCVFPSTPYLILS